MGERPNGEVPTATAGRAMKVFKFGGASVKDAAEELQDLFEADIVVSSINTYSTKAFEVNFLSISRRWFQNYLKLMMFV